ncbi:MAG: hypothetical protein JKY50_08075 [Oleispira sp.]|nr:hypothetical protein [Oleispira sp.]
MQPLNQTSLQTEREVQAMTQEQVSQPASHIVIGQIKEIINDQVIVSYDRNLLPRSQPALATVAISEADISRQVTLLFTEQGQPIVMGFLTPVSTAVSNTEQSHSMAFDIIQDGEHCHIQASKSITIKCGESSISLNSKGEIAINGESITSKARKKHNILGGTINLN